MHRFFEKKSGKDNQWLNTNYVQACVKDSLGVGKVITIQYTAPIDAHGQIVYKDFPQDELFLLQQ